MEADSELRNTSTADHQTLLMIAAENGWADMLKDIADKTLQYADVDAADDNGLRGNCGYRRDFCGAEAERLELPHRRRGAV